MNCNKQMNCHGNDDIHIPMSPQITMNVLIMQTTASKCAITMLEVLCAHVILAVN